MITDIESFLRWFEGVSRRAVRDVTVLPPEAETWRPSAGEGESAWSIGEIVGHMALSRLYFVRAYLDQGWIAEPWLGEDTSTQASWIKALNESAASVRKSLDRSPQEWLARRVELIDTDQSISGWRVLMMMAEHDVHHRSQIDTYAGANGWQVAQIFDRSAEQVAAQRDPQIRKQSSRPGHS